MAEQHLTRTCLVKTVDDEVLHKAQKLYDQISMTRHEMQTQCTTRPGREVAWQQSVSKHVTRPGTIALKRSQNCHDKNLNMVKCTCWADLTWDLT